MTADERLTLIHFKIERAKKHIADLNAAIIAFLDSKPYEVRSKRDPQTCKMIHYVSKVSPTPICLATITGDIIQNLRSALDHLAQQLFLVGTNDAGPGYHTYFLIERCAAEYKSRLPRKVKGMRQDAIDALNAIEPYKGGNGHDLWILHELNNIDKHRLLVTVVSRFQSVNIGAYMAHHLAKAIGKTIPVIDFFMKPADTLCPLKIGDELFIDSPDSEENEQMNFRFEISLSEPSIGESKPLLELVQHFHDLISNTVISFRPCLI